MDTSLKVLKVAFVHLDVRYKDPETNRKNLLRLNREAAIQGADLILNTEMPLAGYSFSSREDISGYVESENGPTLIEIKRLAKKYGTYIGMGLAEHDEATGIYYNSAFVIDPDGRRVCRYRKINAEMRWACPGDPKQSGTFDTPWGRIGVLICSDSYYGMMPRSMAMRGVDLLWVPANWPPSGLDPLELWKGRAIENGFFIAACGRTGKDRIMDCTAAVSCAFDPQGRELFAASSEESRVFIVEIPLNEAGKLFNGSRPQTLQGRNPSLYRSIYLDFRLIDDLTAHYDLPHPGPLNIHCIVPGGKDWDLETFERQIAGTKKEGSSLFVLPPLSSALMDAKSLKSLARQHDVALAASLYSGGPADSVSSSSDETPERENPSAVRVLVTPDTTCEWHIEDTKHPNGKFPFPTVHYGPAKLGMASYELLLHPELAVAFSKEGYDLVVLSENRLDRTHRLLCGIRTIEGIAVAACASNSALISMVPKGHEHWEEQSIEGPGTCSYALDTVRTRKKRFQDRVDFELLLRTP